MNLYELIAALCLLINVYLASHMRLLNFLFGAIGVIIYAVIFFNSKLYADMGLQIVYLFLNIYGAYQWNNHDNLFYSRQVINSLPLITWINIFITTSIIFICLYFILAAYTDSTTVRIDAFTTALSLTAQWMMNKKILANWYCWGIVNVVSIQMYLIKHLYITSILYLIFFILCCFGYVIWRNAINLR